AGPDAAVPFTVWRDTLESRLHMLTARDFETVRRHVDLLEAESLDHLRAAIQGRTFGQELWRYLAVATLILVVVEIVLTRWIAIHRRTGSEPEVSFEDRNRPPPAFYRALEKVRELR
ncbi:MAG: hypothetical protein N2255_00610, partial [Kiritimatiellae bacterium]|nr:hypothetical protein [Kiritimatiellia bacterium]